MFTQRMQQRIDLLHKQLIVTNTDAAHITITENKPEGKASLECRSSNPMIGFLQLEDKKLQYFTFPKCADHLVFEQVSPTEWHIHIFEFKTTVTVSKWDEMIKAQFKGTILQAMAIAGYLEIPFEMRNVRLYTGYRNDKLTDYQNSSPIEIRIQPGISTQGLNDWNEQRIALHLFEPHEFIHSKVKLDIQTGNGVVNL